MESLGQKIRRIRDLNRLSQDRFGKKVGVSGKSISAYETNKTIPPLYVLDRIAKTYDVNMYSIPPSKQEFLTRKVAQILKELSEVQKNLNEDLSL